jgi:hypothetical protein
MKVIAFVLALAIAFPAADRLITHEVATPGAVAGECPSPMEKDPQFGWLYTEGQAHFHLFIYTDKGFRTFDYGINRFAENPEVTLFDTRGLFGTIWKTRLATNPRLQQPQPD